jgi:hypothetical protein
MPEGLRGFQKGHKKWGGREKGVLNHRSVIVKTVLEDAAHSIGGLERLVKWIKEKPENEYAFWTSMFMRLMPVQIQGTGAQGELVVKVSRDDLARKLEERGLPPMVIGRDIPAIDDRVIDIVNGIENGNGSGEGDP